MRSLLILPLCACARLPDIRPCDPTGAVIEPTFVTIGNDDQMIASIRWYGCPDYDFQLCGIGEDWITADGATLGVWHDDVTLDTCADVENIDDKLFNLNALRHLYEKNYKVDSATLLLQVGGIEVPYSFSDE